MDVLKDIEDHLMPRLDVFEKALYYYLFRHTRLLGNESSTFALRPISQAMGISESSVRERIRAMHEKGYLEIQERGRGGHHVRVHLPSEIPHLIPVEQAPEPIDVETVDFYTGRVYLSALLNRQDGRCFWCLKALTPDSCVLDHVVPQHSTTDNSYRNVVAACHACNSDKQGEEATAFLRSRYRKGLLSPEELENRLSILSKITLGELVPEIQ